MSAPTGRRADGSHLPSGFKLQLTAFLPKQLLLAGESPLPGPKGKVKGSSWDQNISGATCKQPYSESWVSDVCIHYRMKS